MFGTIIFGTQIMFGTEFMFGTNHQLFLMHCTEHKLRAEHKMRRAEHIVPKFNGAEVRIPLNFEPSYFVEIKIKTGYCSPFLERQVITV